MDYFGSLHLTYDIGWPLNIVITAATLAKCRQIFRFQLRLYHAHWNTNNIRDLLKTQGYRKGSE